MKKDKLDIAYEKIHEEFDKITPTGRLSKVKSYNVISFLCVAVHCGIERVKEDRQYNKYMKNLEKCGITMEFMIEENEKMKFKKKREQPVFIELKFDFKNQVPEGYVEAKSQFKLEDLLREKTKKEE